MKNRLLLTLLLSAPFLQAQTPCSGGMAGSYPCNGITLQAYIPASAMGAAEGQDSWGWTDTDGNGDEYAIVGLDNGTAFVNITNSTSPVYLGRLDSHTGSSLWRDVKVYNNYAYIVSDGNGNHGMQIFDLTRLRGLTGSPVQNFSEDGWKTWGSGSGRGRAHNIIINEATGFAYVVGTSPYVSGGIVIFDLATNPTNPPLEATYAAGGYCHDAQVIIYDGPDTEHQGKELVFGAFTNWLRILDVTDKNNITQIKQMSYTGSPYTHQGWLTEDRRFFIFGDELDEINGLVGTTRTMVYDVQDLDNPVLIYTYEGATTAIDHNGYVRGNRFYLANYAAGMRIMKIDGLYDPSPSMTEVNYFDMFPDNNSAGFNGTWTIYPYFESGNLIATGFGDEYVNGDGGLFILRDPYYDNTPPNIICQNPTIYLDASTGTVTIDETDLDNGSTDDFGIVKWTVTGQTTFTCADVGNTFNVTLEGEDDYGNKSSCVSIVTIAAAPTTYIGGGTWSAGSPGLGSNAKISFDYNTGTSGSIDACTCEVDAAKTLTIAADDYLNITRDITVNGNLIVEHTGNVVQQDPNAIVTKNSGAVINVELTTPVLQTRDFMVMGSPMDAETRTGVFNSAFLVLEHTPANFIPHPEVLIGGANFADDNYDFWNSFASGPINIGEGYIVRPQSGYTDPANVPFYMTYSQGTLNNGTVTRPIIFNGLGTNPDGTPNVFANPYASAMSGYDFINNNALVNEIYFWEHLTPPSASLPGAGSLNFSMEDISMYNLSGGVKAPNDPGTSTVPNGVISTGQGFGIKAFGAGNATFTNDMRLTSGNTTLRRPNENEIDRIWINVSNTEYEIGSNALIAFNPLATPLLDPGYDSNNIATIISLYSHLDNGTEQLGIQTREAFDSSIKIPMGFASQVDENSTYSISIDAIEGINISNTTVFLVDNRENTIHDLSAESYEFTSGIGTYNERFTLMFEENIVLGSIDSALKSISIFPNPTKNKISVYSPTAAINNIEVFDTRGRRIVELLKKQDHVYQLNLDKLETAVYFIKVNTEIGSITKKVIKE